MTEKNYKGGDFVRPAPTSPRGHPKKKIRREGPPKGFRPRDEPEWSRPPPTLSPPADRFGHETPPDSKPLQLGGYVIQHGPPAPPEFKIRGRSLAPAKSEQGCDSDQEPASLGSLETAFVSVANSIFAHVQNIESFIANSGYPPSHPISRAAARIKAQLDRLSDVYQSMGAEVEGMVHELDQFAAREDELKRDLDGSRAANFKLSCANKDLADQVHDFKCTAAETELELRRIKRTSQDLEAKHERLEADHRELEEERRKAGAEKLWLEDTIRKQEAQMEKAADENRRLQVLVQEKEEEIEGLKSDSLGLQSLVHQRGVEAESARADSMRLQGLLRENEARISSLAALPITPVSPMVSLGSYFSAGPVIPQLLPPRPMSPLPYIKQEVPDQTPEVAYRSELSTEQLHGRVQPLYQLAEQPQDATQQLHQLGAGAANILAKLFHADHPATHNPALISFLTHLGAAPEPSSFINTTTGTTTHRPWHLLPPWTPTPTPTPILHSTLEEQFTHLCLLFPFPGTTTATAATVATTTTSKTTEPTDPATFHLLTALLTSLIQADYSASPPHAARAFLHTMAALFPPGFGGTAVNAATVANTTATRTGQAQHREREQGDAALGTTTSKTVLLTIMLCELCRVLEYTFPSFPSDSERGVVVGGVGRRRWDVADFLGSGVLGVTPLGRLAAVSSEVPDGREEEDEEEAGLGVLKERLARECGDQFCVVRTTAVFPVGGGDGQVASNETSSSSPGLGLDGNTPTTPAGAASESREIGLLHCGGDHGEFLMLDFEERGIRVVDCALAGMRPNAAEPRKLDLIVARAGTAAGQEGEDGEEEVLFWTAAAAPRDVAAFWVRYAMGDV